MDRRSFLHTLGGSAAVLASTGLQAQSAASSGTTATARWSHISCAVYFCAEDIENLLKDPTERRKTIDYFAPTRASRYYLECRSSNEMDSTLMKQVAEAVRAEGIIASGAMVPVAPGGSTCYNNPEHMASIEHRARAMAAIFDELILDDWLFTICTCEKCVAARGDSTWGDYRTKLLREKSKQHIIDPAHQVNPKIKVIIKYPNWQEGHRENGYDVDGETRQFDGMACGIETRQPATQEQHIPHYSGYIFQKWWPGVDPKKWVGSWFDNYGMAGQDNDYAAQAWQAVLAQSPELILWCAGTLHTSSPFSDVYPHFRELMPELDRVAGLLKGESRGVPIYLPYGSEGEYNVFGHLGMAGIPLAPVASYPFEGQSAIFAKQSLRDPELAEKLISRLRGGHDIFLTWGLFRALQNTEFKNMLNLVDTEGSVTSSTFRIADWEEQEPVHSERPFSFAKIAVTQWPEGARDVALVREDSDFGLLLKVKYLNADLYVLNLPENLYDLQRLPAAVLNKIRGAFHRQLEVHLKGPGGTAMYLFGQNQFVLYNMSEKTARVALTFDKAVPSTGWRELVHGKNLTVAEFKPPKEYERWAKWVRSEVPLTLHPFEIAVVQAPW